MYIPRKTKVKMEFFKGITLGDVILACIGIAVLMLMIFSEGITDVMMKVYLSVAWVAIVGSLFFRVADGLPLYATLGLLLKFFAYRKKYSKVPARKHVNIEEIIPYRSIHNDMIDYSDYYAAVLEIRPIEFGLLNEEKQSYALRTFGNALRLLGTHQHLSIVKTSRPMAMDDYIYYEDKKYDSVLERVADGEMTKEEAEARSLLFEARIQKLRDFGGDEKIFKDHFYLVIYDHDHESLNVTADSMISTMSRGLVPISATRLRDQELAVFLKSNYTKDFNEGDLSVVTMADYAKWSIPEKIVFKAGRTIIDGQDYRSFSIYDYPLNVGNAWAWPFFNLDGCRVNIMLKPIPKATAEKQLDRAMGELEGRLGSGKASKQVEVGTQVATMSELISDLKIGNEDLFNVNIHIVCEESVKKEVRGLLKQYGFKYSEMFGRQVESFVSSNISRLEKATDHSRGIQTSAIAAMFPFISNSLQDPNGFYIGYNSYPVFVDLFQRNNERVNSNMMVIGKSGSGKSYATKVLLANLAADNARIFILDPEDEYTDLALNLKGKIIDVGSSVNGILNPFHVMTSLSADEGSEGDSFAQHLQFLEEFFKTIFEGMSSDAFETVNALVTETYKRKNIDNKTDLSKLKPEDYPIFDDLYAVIQEKTEKEQDDYHRRNLQILLNYVQKFASGGRNSNLWNGPTSIVTKENFVCFNFRSLMVNRNMTIANAQMLLVFKYLDNEILKNRDFNKRYETLRKIIVAVDEAHMFINPKFPIALDFMAQMAKRIRKYEGMQIVITQNIKDFVGSADIERQATAVINASQYSMIFSLAPNDITDLVNLYRNAGEINSDEQDAIVTAGRGQCFFIASAFSRTTFMVEANDAIKKLAGLSSR